MLIGIAPEAVLRVRNRLLLNNGLVHTRRCFPRRLLLFVRNKGNLVEEFAGDLIERSKMDCLRKCETRLGILVKSEITFSQDHIPGGIG